VADARCYLATGENLNGHIVVVAAKAWERPQCEEERIGMAVQRAGGLALVFTYPGDLPEDTLVGYNSDMVIPYVFSSNASYIFLRIPNLLNVTARLLPADPECTCIFVYLLVLHVLNHISTVLPLFHAHRDYYLAFIALQGIVTGSLFIWSLIVFIIRLAKFIQKRHQQLLVPAGANQNGLVTIAVGCAAACTLLRLFLHCIDFRNYRDSGVPQSWLNVIDTFGSVTLTTTFSLVACFWSAQLTQLGNVLIF